MRTEPTCFMPPEKCIIAPEGGWKDNTTYIVEVSFNSQNPVHLAMFFSGFLNDAGKPSSYNDLYNPVWCGTHSISDVYYMKVLGELPEEFQIFE